MADYDIKLSHSSPVTVHRPAVSSLNYLHEVAKIPTVACVGRYLFLFLPQATQAIDMIFFLGGGGEKRLICVNFKGRGQSRLAGSDCRLLGFGPAHHLLAFVEERHLYDLPRIPLPVEEMRRRQCFKLKCFCGTLSILVGPMQIPIPRVFAGGTHIDDHSIIRHDQDDQEKMDL